jgi:hypothetical protein
MSTSFWTVGEMTFLFDCDRQSLFDYLL